MDDLLSEFLTETKESMDTLDVELVKFEQNPNDEAILSNIFRLVHTIKGTCGFLGLPRLEAVAHASENVLGQFREGKLEVSAAAVTLILESLDCIKAILDNLEQTEAEPEGDDSELIEHLNHLAETGEVPGAVGASADEAAAAKQEDEEAAAAMETEAAAEPAAPATGSAALDAMMNSEEVAQDSPELQAAFEAAEYKGPGDPMAAKKRSEAGGADEKPAEEVSQVPAPVKETAPAAADSHKDDRKTTMAAEKKEGSGIVQTIRVNVDLLENLMTMVSELVLTRNQLLQILRSHGDKHGDSEFNAPLQRLSHVTSELQEGVMKTRMQPIGNAWAKLPRIVRDLSIELNKKIDLQMIGAETELDRQVLDIIKDPLTHMVRNSADHGIEDPATREASGKSETGTITLNAYHEGGHIHIEISDDGRGLNMARIREKVISNGLASESELESMNDHQIQQFIFAAGFSTAQQVTSVSGRGVGMDVVKTNIDKIGGNVELKSVEGKGSTFLIKIPLTLAIVSALIVECAEERFAIPQISVVELVRSSDNSEHTIENIHGTPVLRLRNVLLPLVRLRQLLGVPGEEEQDLNREHFIVVAQVGTNSFGIIVDKIFDSEEIVVKPVSSILRNIEIFSGNTILGDGSVILILDLNGIAKTLGEMSGVADHRAAEEAAAIRAEGDAERVALLLFRAGSEAPKAVPLGLVARLEEVDFDKVEFTNGQALVQYRGQLMPLVPINDSYTFPETGKKPTLVFSDRDRSMGLVVDEILDIVEDRLNVELSAERTGMVGSAIVNGKATEIIDTGYYLTQAFSDWFGSGADQIGGVTDRRKVLLVDDSAFFRNLLSPILSVAGYEVTAVEGGEAAMNLCERGEKFDIIVSDIEMPGMNGFDLCRTIRSGSRWQDLPVVAMTSRTSPSDLEQGREVGFTDYVAKHDRDGLLQALADTAWTES